MKYLVLIFASYFLINTTFSQDKTAYQLSDFDELIVIGNFQVEVVQSDRKEALVSKHADEVDLNNLSFSYTKNVLTIKYSGSFVETIDIHLVINSPHPLNHIEARRGAEIRVNHAGDFDSNVSYKSDSGGKLLIRNISAPSVQAEISKGGSIRLIGQTETFEPTVKTGGTIAAAQLKSNEVNASVMLGGEIICAPEKKINAKVNSGGTISYSGNPKVTQKITFGGTIKQL